ncbi:hypothetical protein OAB57_03530 [Bacteriovoracaceae bacterium]|nr:hypothetical protein [Bacteriovoracaceae bacterium]
MKFKVYLYYLLCFIGFHFLNSCSKPINSTSTSVANTTTGGTESTCGTNSGIYTMCASEIYTNTQTATGNAVATIATSSSGAPRYLGTFSSLEIADTNNPSRSYNDFYTKYTTAYDADCSNWPHTKGIPILGTSNTDSNHLLAARTTVVNMLRSRPWRSSQWDMRDYMVASFNRVIAAGNEVRADSSLTTDSGKKFGDHPEAEYGTELGGASVAEPSTGYEPYGACYSGNTVYTFTQERDVLIEEYGHSIEEMFIKNIEPCAYSLIGKAMCLAAINSKFSCESWPGDLGTCGNEYFASVFEYAFGNNDINSIYKPDGSTGTTFTKQNVFTNDIYGFCLAAAFYDMTASTGSSDGAHVTNSLQAQCNGNSSFPIATTSNSLSSLDTTATLVLATHTGSTLSTTFTNCQDVLEDLRNNVTSCSTEALTGRTAVSSACTSQITTSVIPTSVDSGVSFTDSCPSN